MHTVVAQTSAQVGKTEVLLNAIGYFIHQDPGTILLVQPNVEPLAESFSKERLAPMVRDTPVLRGLVADAKQRDSGNTILHKEFPGGLINIAGANSAASLAGRPVRNVMCDEVDKYPASVENAGDPIELAKSRSRTFRRRRKLVLTSTPKIKGYSRIETAYEESDRRRYWVPCPDCGEHQVLRWANVRWSEGDPSSARYVCGHCGSLWDDGARWNAVRLGEWRAEAPFRGTAGFHLSALYSPWVTLDEMATTFVAAKNSRSAERMQQFVNEWLGDTWEVTGETVDEGSLRARAEAWEGIPKGVLVRTVGIDVQPDRFEIEHVGWGDAEESWSLDYKVIHGDPEGKAIWADLDRYLAEIKPHAVCIDSGGSNTQAVYAWSAGKLRRRIYAVKGMAGTGRPVWPPLATKTKKGGRLYIVGVDAAKDSIYSRLKLTTAGPGYCHFPSDREEGYFEGLTAETVRTRYSKGFPVREWHKKTAHARNEPLDCRVYAYAALCSLSVNWARVRAKLTRKSEQTAVNVAGNDEEVQETPQVVPQTPKTVPMVRIRSRWATNW